MRLLFLGMATGGLIYPMFFLSRTDPTPEFWSAVAIAAVLALIGIGHALGERRK